MKAPVEAGARRMSDSLEKNLGIRDPVKLTRLLDGFGEATARHQQIGPLYDPGISFKEMEQAIISMAGATKKIERGRVTPAAVRQLHGGLNMIPAPWRVLLDQMGGDLFDFAATVRSISTERPAEAQTASARLSAALATFADQLCRPGSGNAKRQAKKFTAGIQALARAYREALPDYAASSTKEGRFCIYVLIWLNDCMGQNVDDPSRHIVNALDDEARWQKLSL